MPGTWIVKVILGEFDFNIESHFVSGIIISILIYFCIGALIGWIVGKIKNSKETN